MSSTQRTIGEDASIHVAAYESLLDLFTLVSFVLIFAAFTHVAQSAVGSSNLTLITAQNAREGAGAPEGLPKDVLLVVVSRTDAKDWITLEDGIDRTKKRLEVTADRLEQTLDGFSTQFGRAPKINVGVYEAKEPVSSAVMFSLQRWLSSRGYKRYYLYFVRA